MRYLIEGSPRLQHFAEIATSLELDAEREVGREGIVDDGVDAHASAAQAGTEARVSARGLTVACAGCEAEIRRF
jgi:hypothetical protein